MPESSENTQPLVSIIVPAYNKCGTLKRCVKSLQDQTYTNLEILIIDDCSTDGTNGLASAMAASDKRVKIIELSENIGSYKVRILGVNKARGEFVAFVDADDTMEPRAIELMLKMMTDLQVDLVQMRYRRRMKGLAVKYMERWEPEIAGRKIEGLDFRGLASYVGMDSYIYPSCWGKLYRSNLLRSIQMVDFNQFWGDDQIFNIQYLRNCRSMAFLDYVGYCYYWGGDTSSNYKFSLMREYKNVHTLKRVMGQSEEYINAELQMLLRYHIRQLLTELAWTRKAVLSVIADELKDPIWRYVGLGQKADELVDEEYARVQKSPIKYLAKKLLK